jgi:hypothetical protein
VPDQRTLERLLDWRPKLGLISVYVVIDPAERREPWRVALRERLDGLPEAEPDRRGRRRRRPAALLSGLWESFARDAAGYGTRDDR